MVDAQDDSLLAELDEFICPISGVVMQNPVLADDNRTYEREYIQQWFQSCRTRNLPITSPWTRAVISENLQKDIKIEQAMYGKLHELCFRGRLENVSSIHELRTIFDELDKQREILSETLAGWQPPQLAVIGSESSGKSTLLERLVMMPIFPTDESFCTRLPVHVRLRNASIPQAPQLEVFNTRTRMTEDGPHMISAQSGALDVRDKMQDIIAKESRPEQGVSTERIIILHIVGPHVPSIDLIDLPGLISTPPLLRERTHDLLEQFLREYREYSFYLAVLPATMRPNTSLAIEFVQKHDLEGMTLGVFTKCDDLTSVRQESFKALMQDPPSSAHGGVALKPHGWHATMNAPISASALPGASNFSRLFEQAKREEQWFGLHLPELVKSGRGGCAGLVHSISAVFLENVRTTWGPRTIRKLEEAAQCAQRENAALGLPALHIPSDANTLLARFSAAKFVREVLTEAVPQLAQRCCTVVLARFKDGLIAAATAPISVVLTKDITEALAERKEALLEECRRGLDAWGEFWIAEATAVLRRVHPAGFVLGRFPTFVDALLERLRDIVQREKVAMCMAVLTLLGQFLDEASPWIKTETQLRAQPSTITLKSDGLELVERIVVVFLRRQVLGALAECTTEIAEEIDAWVESCAAERKALMSRVEQIESAKAGIIKVLGSTSAPAQVSDSVAPLVAGTILGADVLKDPRYVGLDLEGRIMVSDAILHQVLVFSTDGTLVRRFGSDKGKGASAGHFDGPRGVAVDGQGRVVVAEKGNHRIQVLNADGSVARCFGSEGTAVGQLNQPTGVAVDRQGRIVVAESGNHRIQVFNEDGSVASHFGSKGSSVGKLNSPLGVAVDRAGRIVVADYGNHRVQVYNSDGSVSLCFGSAGNGPVQFNRPRGVAVDKEGRFVVADASNHRVLVFDSDGNAAQVIGAAGSRVGHVKHPFGVAVNGAGRIIVTEEGGSGSNHRVQLF